MATVKFKDSVIKALQRIGINLAGSVLTKGDLLHIQGICIKGTEETLLGELPLRDLANSFHRIIVTGVTFPVDKSKSGLWISDLIKHFQHINSLAIFSPPKELDLDFIKSIPGLEALIVRDVEYKNWSIIFEGHQHLSTVCLERCFFSKEHMRALSDMSVRHISVLDEAREKAKKQKKPLKVKINDKEYIFPHLPHLGDLYLIDCKLTEIDELQGIKGVRHLELSRNQIKDISALRKMSWLNTVILDRNQIKSISPLKELEGLFYLDLRYNCLTSIKDMYEFKSRNTLSRLFLRHNDIKDIAPAKVFDIHPRTSDIYYYD